MFLTAFRVVGNHRLGNVVCDECDWDGFDSALIDRGIVEPVHLRRIKFAGVEAMVLSGMLVISKLDKPATEKGLALR